MDGESDTSSSEEEKLPPKEVTEPPPPFIPRRSTRIRSLSRKARENAAASVARKVSSPDYPTLKEALASKDAPLWREAILKEITELKERGTWILVPRPKKGKGLPCKTVLKVKRNADGSIDKHKARIVILGCLQDIFDYDETYSSVADFTTIRAAIGLAEYEGAEIHQLDITNAFLCGTLDEEIYMQQPEGFEEAGKEDHVCLLQKSIYGLKQAPRVWHHALRESLLKIGLVPLHHAESAFSGNSKIIVFVYVDDMLIISKDTSLIAKVKKDTSEIFKVKDLGIANFFLGVEIERNNTGSFIHQKGYIRSIMSKYGME